MSRPEADCSTLCLLTRPAHQLETLRRAILAHGMQALSFPTIEITAPDNAQMPERLVQKLLSSDIALFVSRNAVEQAFAALPAKSWPPGLKLGVIGQGTRDALRRVGFEPTINPQHSFNSEGLLQASGLQRINGREVLILRGQEGRNLLGDTLQQRGARVEYVEVYRRRLPHYPERHFARLTEARFPDIAVFTSAEGMRNCFELVDQASRQRLRRLPWLLISDRMGETAVDLGHNASIVVADKASDEGIITALEKWRRNTHQNSP